MAMAWRSIRDKNKSLTRVSYTNLQKLRSFFTFISDDEHQTQSRLAIFMSHFNPSRRQRCLTWPSTYHIVSQDWTIFSVDHPPKTLHQYYYKILHQRYLVVAIFTSVDIKAMDLAVRSLWFNRLTMFKYRLYQREINLRSTSLANQSDRNVLYRHFI